jgi:hypothetical protein
LSNIGLVAIVAKIVLAFARAESRLPSGQFCGTNGAVTHIGTLASPTSEISAQIIVIMRINSIAQA